MSLEEFSEELRSIGSNLFNITDNYRITNYELLNEMGEECTEEIKNTMQEIGKLLDESVFTVKKYENFLVNAFNEYADAEKLIQKTAEALENSVSFGTSAAQPVITFSIMPNITFLGVLFNFDAVLPPINVTDITPSYDDNEKLIVPSLRTEISKDGNKKDNSLRAVMGLLPTLCPSAEVAWDYPLFADFIKEDDFDGSFAENGMSYDPNNNSYLGGLWYDILGNIDSMLDSVGNAFQTNYNSLNTLGFSYIIAYIIDNNISIGELGGFKTLADIMNSRVSLNIDAGAENDKTEEGEANQKFEDSGIFVGKNPNKKDEDEEDENKNKDKDDEAKQEIDDNKTVTEKNPNKDNEQKEEDKTTPADPTVQPGQTPADPTVQPGQTPADPTVQPGQTPADPTVQPGQTPVDPTTPTENNTTSTGSENSNEAGIPSEAETSNGVETPTKTEVPTKTETPTEGKAPAETETPIEGEAPAEAETPTEGKAPTESEAPAETEAPIEGEAPTETEAPIEGEAPTETEAPIEGEAPAETEAPTEADGGSNADGQNDSSHGGRSGGSNHSNRRDAGSMPVSGLKDKANFKPEYSKGESLTPNEVLDAAKAYSADLNSVGLDSKYIGSGSGSNEAYSESYNTSESFYERIISSIGGSGYAQNSVAAIRKSNAAKGAAGAGVGIGAAAAGSIGGVGMLGGGAVSGAAGIAQGGTAAVDSMVNSMMPVLSHIIGGAGVNNVFELVGNVEMCSLSWLSELRLF